MQRLRSGVHRRIGAHQDVDDDPRQEPGEGRDDADLLEGGAERGDRLRRRTLVRADAPQQRGDRVGVEVQSVDVVEVGHSALVHGSEEGLRFQSRPAGAGEPAHLPRGGDVVDDVVVAEVVDVAVAVEDQHLVDRTAPGRQVEDRLALQRTHAGVEQVERGGAPVDHDRRDVRVLPHAVRVVALDDPQVRGDLVNVRVSHRKIHYAHFRLGWCGLRPHQ